MSASEIPLGEIQQYKSLRASVTDALRSAIILGDLEEGQLYSAPALAAPLGVSATPVREAMMDLAREGLVTTMKNKGFRITEMTGADLEEQTQVRQLLEGPAMRALAGHVPEADLASLRELADRIADGAREGDLHSYLQGDREFHARLLEHTGNRRLVDLTTRLRGQTRMRALRRLADSGRLVGSAQEHHRLLDLLAAGDGEGAYGLIVQHIGHTSRLWSTGDEETGGTDSPLLDLVPPT
ncbi:GntR family transcriptional regulator [Brachybacterium vulturis]|uniref:GntR family transcriptional regulator n=1 Tax=Brachybacterium vulturis TaxID=2017484 RepID=UPI0037351804